MRRIPFASLIVLAGLVRAAEVLPSTPPGTPPRSGSIETTAQRDASPKPAISQATAAKLAAAAPKYVPPAAEPRAPEPAESPVIQTAEKNRPQIIRLPQFFVGEPRVHVPAPLEVLTSKGRAELGFARRPGLRIVPLASMNAPIAVAMLEDDREAQRRAQEANLWSLFLIK